MANKMHPGAFRCYEAALPDEPMFVLLGRDPAAPATMEFWANERVRQGKTSDTDDNARIGAALREADEMRQWRQKILDAVDPLDGVPAWRLPRPEEHGDDRPIRSIPTYEKVDPDAPGGRTIHAHPALGAPYSGYDNRLHTHRELMVSVGKEVREIAHALTEIYRNARVPGEMADLIAKLHSEVERLADAARKVKLSDTDPYAEFAKNLGKPVEHDYYPDPDGDPVKVTPLSFTRMSELLDYATCYGEFDENTPDGTISKYGEQMSSPMNSERRTAIWVYKRCMGVIPEGVAPPVSADPPAPTPRATSRDVTEIETPEMPPHRFAMFDKGTGWAYGRGLEISPSHIPAMLDRMEADGYTLVAALGSQADKVGMIFQRGPRYSSFELVHGFGGGFDTATGRSTEPSPQMEAFASGKPLDEIADIGYGNGQQP